MIRGRRQSPLLSAVLAVLALVGFFTLSTWHDARPHIDRAPHAGVLSNHDRHDPDAGNNPLHLAAHAAGQSIDLPADSGDAVPAKPILPETFAAAALHILIGREPSSPLPPPRG